MLVFPVESEGQAKAVLEEAEYRDLIAAPDDLVCFSMSVPALRHVRTPRPIRDVMPNASPRRYTERQCSLLSMSSLRERMRTARCGRIDFGRAGWPLRRDLQRWPEWVRRARWTKPG